MAFEVQSAVEGSPVSYKMSPQAKKYTFKDLGFSETKKGNFQYDRSLDMTVGKTAPRLKITVDKELQTLKMSVTTPNGMRQLNIFADDTHKDLRDNLSYILNEMVARGCFEIVE